MSYWPVGSLKGFNILYSNSYIYSYSYIIPLSPDTLKSFILIIALRPSQAVEAADATGQV